MKKKKSKLNDVLNFITQCFWCTGNLFLFVLVVALAVWKSNAATYFFVIIQALNTIRTCYEYVKLEVR